MEYLNYHLLFTLWLMISPTSSQESRPRCHQELHHEHYYASWVCEYLHLTEHNPILANISTTNMLGFRNIVGNFGPSVLAPFPHLKTALIYESHLDTFQMNCKTLENLQVLHTALPEGTTFLNCCSNLEKLTIRNNMGLALDAGAFVQLHKLKKLYLTDQRVGRITRDTFRGLRSLKKLSMINTTTEAVEAEGFRDLTRLRELYLQDDTMERIDLGAFRSLRRLTSLTIYGKRLPPLPLEMFSEQKGLVEIGLPLATWREVDIEQIPVVFPRLYAHSYIGEWRDEEEREYFSKKFMRLSELLVMKQYWGGGGQGQY